MASPGRRMGGAFLVFVDCRSFYRLSFNVWFFVWITKRERIGNICNAVNYPLDRDNFYARLPV